MARANSRTPDEEVAPEAQTPRDGRRAVLPLATPPATSGIDTILNRGPHEREMYNKHIQQWRSATNPLTAAT